QVDNAYAELQTQNLGPMDTSVLIKSYDHQCVKKLTK
ncbi:MAG: hypothetical protein ACJAYB_003384, partial [Psychromonas sp.]